MDLYNGGRPHKIAENQGFHRNRVPEPACIHKLVDIHLGHNHAHRRGPQKLLVFLYRKGLRIQVALHIVTAYALQEVGLLHGLYTLCNYRELEPLGHTDHRTQDSPATVTTDSAIDELQIQLQNVEFDILQNIQRRIPAAEIIHLHRIAQLVQLLDGIDDHLSIRDGGCLRQFHVDKPGGNVELLPYGIETLNIFRAQDVVTRHIHGNSCQGAIGVDTAPEELTNMLKDVQVQRGNQAHLLKSRDKIRRRDKTVLLRFPTDKGLGANQRTRRMVVLGLKIDLELALLDGGFKRLRNLPKRYHNFPWSLS